MLLKKMSIYKQLIVLGFCLLGKLYGGTSAVTYNFSGGRFGDNLLAYIHAKWISYQYNLPLLYKPFKYSSELNLDDEELQYSDQVQYFRHQIVLNRRMPKPTRPDTVFTCPYFPEIEWELKKDYYFTFPIDWKDKQFREHVWHSISPKKPLNLIHPPHMLNIAIHMREGGGFDDEEHKLKHPLKTPPISFYVTSLYKILQMFPDQPIYCYVFTDAIDPQAWVNKIIAAMPPQAPIQIAYRAQDNHHDSYVLEDFFSLFNFDILIRAESNYSIIPGLIHDYAVVCYPKKYLIENRIVEITEIIVDVNQDCCNECSRKYLQIQGDYD